MNQLIFGGSKGVLFQNHLITLSESISKELEIKISHNLIEERIKKEIKTDFQIKKLRFDIKNAIVEDSDLNRLKRITINSNNTQEIVIKTYNCKVPFTGNSRFLKYRPIFFHGFDLIGKITECDYKNQQFLSFTFQCKENAKEQFNHLKTESLENLELNCSEINKEINNWNTKRLDEIINHLYPKFHDYYVKTKEFETIK
ncbi:hypothetical protein ABGT15_04800 [Flavobacterium enshiense]|uniref:hypothetical protein n=1 Tax=Flavobacterium enshiense TaxID=1341165 RepID=UPI00345DEFEC